MKPIWQWIISIVCILFMLFVYLSTVLDIEVGEANPDAPFIEVKTY